MFTATGEDSTLYPPLTLFLLIPPSLLFSSSSLLTPRRRTKPQQSITLGVKATAALSLPLSFHLSLPRQYPWLKGDH
jgi:hypothetical protein